MMLSNETSISCNKARYYNPNLGRFVSEDPLGLIIAADGRHLYFYAGDNPVRFTDPRGLDATLPNVPGNCLSYALGYFEDLPGPAANQHDPHWPETYMTKMAQCRLVKCTEKCECDNRKVVVFTNVNDWKKWHAMRQQCNGQWSSKNGGDPPITGISGTAIDYYKKVFKPKGDILMTCWCCPSSPPVEPGY